MKETISDFLYYYKDFLIMLLIIFIVFLLIFVMLIGFYYQECQVYADGSAIPIKFSVFGGCFGKIGGVWMDVDKIDSDIIFLNLTK